MTATLIEPQVAAAPPTPRRPVRLILALVLLADALDVIDATVTNVAAPTIAHDLHGGAGLLKWLGAAYMLAMGVLLVVGGRLGDKFGQRRLFLVGMGGFTLASAVAGFAPDPTLLIAARIAQGAFGALLLPQGMAIMARSFTPELMAKAFGLFGPVLGTAGVLGPVLAGFVISANVFGLSWRPLFLVNVVLGTAGLAVARRVLPQDDGDRSTVIDGRGSALLAGAMFGLLYGLVEGSSDGWGVRAVVPLVAGVAFLAAFANRQRTAADPLVKPSLLQNKGFTSGLLVGLAVFAATTGLIYVLSLFVQQGLHASPRTASLALAPLMLGIIAAAFAAMGGLVAKLGRTLIALGLAVVLAGCGWVLALVEHSGTGLGVWALAPALFVTGVGIGCCTSTVYSVALGDADPDEAGSASGALSSIQQLASGTGSAAVASLFFRAAGSGLAHAMTVTLLVVMVVTALSIPVVALMPRSAPAEG